MIRVAVFGSLNLSRTLQVVWGFLQFFLRRVLKFELFFEGNEALKISLDIKLNEVNIIQERMQCA